MVQNFGVLPDGTQAYLYTIQNGDLTARISDFGAALVQLFVPDKNGNIADVVLGHADATGYWKAKKYMGSTIGRNANRIRGAAFELDGQTVQLEDNDNGNSLHSGSRSFALRSWQVEAHDKESITFFLDSPHADQGFPGNARVWVSYILEAPNTLRIVHRGCCDQRSVFNMTNHSCFNLAGHEHTSQALEQMLYLPGDYFLPADSTNIPTGALHNVAGTPMDFRTSKPIGRDMDTNLPLLRQQKGYDHTFPVVDGLAAVLHDPLSGRTMHVYTDCPGVHFYSGNYINDPGKDGVFYPPRSGIALETHCFPDAVHNPQWKQPIFQANTPYYSETRFLFT